MLKKITVLLLIMLPQLILAQEYLSEADPIVHFQSGLDLLDKQMYNAAREEFENYLQQDRQGEMAAEAEYYIAYAALRLYHADGEARLSEFVERHHTHPKAIRANYELGNFYFKDENFKKATDFFEKTDVKNLTQEEKNTRNFKLGYAYFSQKQFDKAKPLLDEVKNTQSSYSTAANYYAGFIAYENQNYTEALTDLRKASQEDSYAQAVPYLIANIYYKQKKYDDLIRYGERIMQGNGEASGAIKSQAEIQLLMGESYFIRKQYERASDYFEAFAAERRPSPEERYRMAYAQYKTGKNEAAVENFKQIASQDDAVGQYASYYLGLLYVGQDNKPFAASAFERASHLNFDEEVKEQAGFNLGKVYFSMEEFSRAIDAFSAFKEAFPNSRYMVEVNDLLSESYLNTQNYQQAITFIESLPDKTYQVRKAYQKVSFYAGTQAFNNSKFYQSVQLFEKSLENPVEEDLVVAANFWRGEAYSTGKKYEEAIQAYENVLKILIRKRPEGQNALYQLKSHYGLGYAYFNTSAYRKALDHFQEYVQQIDQKFRGNTQNRLFYEDAMIRLADCYYVTKAYGKAIDTYQQAVRQNNPEISYAYFQMGVIQGIQGKTREAKQNLETVISRYPDSRYRDEAVFQKAQVSFQERNYQEAVAGFTQLIRSSPNSNLVPYALLRRAVAYTNQKQYAQASADYKKILDDYISHQTANSALLGLQEVISASGNDNGGLDPYIARFKEANPENTSLANIEFESAKNLYFSQKYDLAVEKLLEFVDNYENNPNVDEARFYIGESFYRANQIDQALEVYYDIVLKGTSSRMSRATQRIAELEQARGNHEQAITYFKKLEQLARNKREQFEAWSGLMTSHFELGRKNQVRLDSVEKYADLILEKGNVSARAENIALLYKGKASFERGNYDQAIDDFLKTLNAAKDVYGAEAQYLMAKAQYEQGKYAESIETLYDLNKNFSLYENWLGESFLLIADNYIALEENFQAKATLESLIENSPLPDIVKTAKERLQALNELEAEQEQKEKEADSLQQEQENQIIIEEDSGTEEDTLSNPDGSQPK